MYYADETNILEDRVERAEAEVARLRGIIDEMVAIGNAAEEEAALSTPADTANQTEAWCEWCACGCHEIEATKRQKHDAEVARLREALAGLFGQIGISLDAYGEPWCQWCQSKGETGLEGNIVHEPGCPFAALSTAADVKGMED